MMEWIYRFTTNDQYPDPLEEIDALCAVDANEEPVFLLLADRTSPPMYASFCGEIVGLCTSDNVWLILHGTAVVAGPCVRGNTPSSVRPIYGELTGRVFCPLKDLERLPTGMLPEETLSHTDQNQFLKGQSFAKRLTPAHHGARRRATLVPPGAKSSEAVTLSTPLTFPILVFRQVSSPFTVVGLDATAGTWESKMVEGRKKMPSFCLRWDGKGFTPDDSPLNWHLRNEGFEDEVNGRQARVVCIDGPCDSNGPRLLPDFSGGTQMDRTEPVLENWLCPVKVSTIFGRLRTLS
jgi:hypothetical protein